MKHTKGEMPTKQGEMMENKEKKYYSTSVKSINELSVEELKKIIETNKWRITELKENILNIENKINENENEILDLLDKLADYEQ